MVRQIQFNLGPNTQRAGLLIGDTLKQCHAWLAKQHPGYKAHPTWADCPQYLKIDYSHYVLIDKKGFRPGLLVHELSHMVTGLMNDETRSSLIDSFMDEAFKRLTDYGYKLTYKK